MLPSSFQCSITRYPAGLRQHLHTHDELQLSIVLSGVVVERVERSTAIGRALSVVVKAPGVPHADDFGDDGALVARLSLPATYMSALGGDEAVPDWSWLHEVQFATPFLRLLTRHASGITEFASDDDDVVELLAAATEGRAVSEHGVPPVWLRDIVASLSVDTDVPLRVSDWAARVGVHPVYLARTLRRWYHRSPGEMLREARLQRAAHAVTSSDRTVSVLAHASGFADEPHLCRAMRAHAGVSPGGLRALVRRLDERAAVVR